MPEVTPRAVDVGGDTSGDDTSGDDTSEGDTSGDDTSGDDTSGDDTSEGDTSEGDISEGDISGILPLHIHRSQLVFRSQAAHRFTCLPHFAVAEFFQFYFQFFTVIRLTV